MSFSKREDIPMVCFSIIEDDFDDETLQQQQQQQKQQQPEQQQSAAVVDKEESKCLPSAPYPLLQQTQQKVGEIIGIMIQNVDRVMERDEQCAMLDGRAHDLEIGATQFETTTNRLARKKCIAHLKSFIVLGMVGAVLIIIILMAIWPAKTRVEQRG